MSVLQTIFNEKQHEKSRAYFALSKDAEKEINRQSNFTKFLLDLKEACYEADVLPQSYSKAAFFSFILHENKLPYPLIEIFPQKFVAYTWRKDRTGILNIAFNEKGNASYAAFLGDSKVPVKGYFSEEIPQEVFSLIHQITEV